MGGPRTFCTPQFLCIIRKDLSFWSFMERLLSTDGNFSAASRNQTLDFVCAKTL